MNKEKPGSHYFSFFALNNLLTQTCLHFCTLLLNMLNVHLLLHLFASLCHILYFDEAKFSKLFSLIYFTVSVSRGSTSQSQKLNKVWANHKDLSLGALLKGGGGSLSWQHCV